MLGDISVADNIYIVCGTTDMRKSIDGLCNIIRGKLSMDPDQEKLIYSLGGTRRDVLRKALLPGSIPLIVSNMKVNAGLCLVGVMIGEFLAADKGLGYLIIYGSQVFKMDLVIMSIVILCLMAALLYQGIAFLEKKVSRRL